MSKVEKGLHEVVLALGSNLGSRESYLEQARHKIGDYKTYIKSKSSIYETEAWGNKNQQPYLNQVVLCSTSLLANELLMRIHQIEESMGRIRREKWESRTIDIDILYYDHEVINSENLKVPHPEIQHRKFVLIPLSEILPKQNHPLLKSTNTELLKMCEDSSRVVEWVKNP